MTNPLDIAYDGALEIDRIVCNPWCGYLEAFNIDNKAYKRSLTKKIAFEAKQTRQWL